MTNTKSKTKPKTTKRARKSARARVLFRPKRPPKWWPRINGVLQYVGAAQAGAGWILGGGDLFHIDDVDQVQANVREDWGPGTLFCVEVVK